MTGRQRLLALMDRRPVDRLAWTTLVDDKTRSVMPPAVRDLTPWDFYRHIGCDIFQFGNYGLPAAAQVTSPARRITPGVEVEVATTADGIVEHRQKTAWGTLVSRTRDGHPIRYPVESLRDVEILTRIWAATRYEEVPGAEDSYRKAEAAIGDAGLYVPTLAPSPVQHLLEYDMGPANFYYLLNDHPHKVQELLEVMQAARLEEYEIVARRSPAPALMLVENTSTTLISPAFYRRWSLPQVRAFTETAHRYGKKAVLHMCGLLKHLTPELAETGMDAVNALTPPPVGDLAFDEALDRLGEDLVILGGTFDSTLFQKPDVTPSELRAGLERLYTPRIRRASLLLWLVADGLPTPLERFLVVRDWMDAHGCR